MRDLSYQACAALVQRGDEERFMAVMAAPSSARAVLFPLFAFNLEVARAPWVSKEPLIAQMRLQWWRDVVEGSDAANHEIGAPLSALIKEEQLDPDLLLSVIDARLWDIDHRAFESWDEFDAHIDASSSDLLWAGAKALGGHDEESIRALAYAGGVARWFAAVPALEEAGCQPFPDGRPEAVKSLAERALLRLSSAKRRLGPASCVGRTVWTAGPILRQVVAAPRRVAEGSLGVSPFALKAGLMWRAALRRA